MTAYHALWLLSVLSLLLGLWVLFTGRRAMAMRGIVGALLVAFGGELLLALCYVSSTR